MIETVAVAMLTFILGVWLGGGFGEPHGTVRRKGSNGPAPDGPKPAPPPSPPRLREGLTKGCMPRIDHLPPRPAPPTGNIFGVLPDKPWPRW